MIPKKLLSSYLRSVTGLAVGALFWAVVGWGLASITLGLCLGLWVLAGGPLLIPTGTWFAMRLSGKLRRLSVSPSSPLAHDYLAAILRSPGPAPRVWIREGLDCSFFWFERGLFKQSRQDLVVTRAWLEQRAPAKRSADWKAIWRSMQSLPRSERRLRNFQMAAWVGIFSPLELLLGALWATQILVGLGDTPSPAFWFQRICWLVRETWLGLPSSPEEAPTTSTRSGVVVPAAWNSVLWGVWHQIPADLSHSTWGLLLHHEAFLEP